MSRTIDIEALCADKGLRITEQRKTIARVLGDSEDHPDVETLHQRAAAVDPNISIATVYRTVRLFEEAGHPRAPRIRRRPLALRSGQRPHHDHLIDVETGKVIEFVDEELEDSAEADRREARLPPRRSPHGAVRSGARSRPLTRRSHVAVRIAARVAAAAGWFLALRAAASAAQADGPASPWPRRFLRGVALGVRRPGRGSWRAGGPHTLAPRQSCQLARHPRSSAARPAARSSPRTSSATASSTGSPTRTTRSTSAAST